MKHHPNEFQSLTVYGGVNIDDQTRALRHGVDFFVGTCGRVLDHIERGNIDFSALKTVILDEADQMLKQGFKEEVDKVSVPAPTLWRPSHRPLVSLDPCPVQKTVWQRLANPAFLCDDSPMGARRCGDTYEAERAHCRPSC